MKSDLESNSKDEAEEIPRFLESKPLKAKPVTIAQKKQGVILGLLILLLGFLVIQTFMGDKKKQPRFVVKAAIPSVSVVEEVALTPENDLFQAPSLDDETRSSPFARVPSETERPSQGPAPLVLLGVLSDSSGSAYAVINEKIVKKGERMADKVVTAIQSDSVTLRSDSGEEETLRMKA